VKILVNLKIRSATDLLDLEEYCQREWGMTLNQKLEQVSNEWINRALHSIADHKVAAKIVRLEESQNKSKEV
jgi:hypothetical protein